MKLVLGPVIGTVPLTPYVVGEAIASSQRPPRQSAFRQSARACVSEALTHEAVLLLQLFRSWTPLPQVSPYVTDRPCCQLLIFSRFSGGDWTCRVPFSIASVELVITENIQSQPRCQKHFDL